MPCTSYPLSMTLTGKKLGVAESDLEAVRFVDFLEV